MKNLFKILVPSFIAISLMSCMATTASDNYAYNDTYSQGYSDGYIDGYYRSPDGIWYAPNVVYLDNNNNYYRNGAVYNSGSRNKNMIISPKRNSAPSGMRPQTPVRSMQNGIRTQNNIRVQPNPTQSAPRSQSQNNIRTQPQNSMRSGSQNNRRVQPQSQENNNSQRSNGSR